MTRSPHPHRSARRAGGTPLLEWNSVSFLKNNTETHSTYRVEEVTSWQQHKGCRTENLSCWILTKIGSEKFAEAIYTAFRNTPLSFWLLLQIVTLFNTKSADSHCRGQQKPHGDSETPCRLLRQFHWAQWTLFCKTDSLICTGDLPKQWLRQIYNTVFWYVFFYNTQPIQMRDTPVYRYWLWFDLHQWA